MTNYIRVGAGLILISTLWGCTANSNNYALNAQDAEALRVQTDRLEQRDRDIKHAERMRRADAYSRATRNIKGGITNSSTTVIVPR